MHLVELPHLAVRSPADVAVARVAPIQLRNLFEAVGCIETRRQFASERLVVDETIGTCRANGLFVKAFGIELATFDVRDLGADQRSAVLEILRAICRPDLELSVVRDQSLDMLPSLAGRCGLARCRPGECTVEVVLCRIEQ
jgi:hypothetical protein